VGAKAQDPDSRDPPPEISVLQAAEAEARSVLRASRAVNVPILVYHHVVPGRAGGSEVTHARS
jgi:hypothetical protein